MVGFRKVTLSLRPNEMYRARFALDAFFGALIGATLAGSGALNPWAQLTLIAVVALVYLGMCVARLAKPAYCSWRSVGLLILAGAAIAVALLVHDLAIAVPTMLAIGCWCIIASALDFLCRPVLGLTEAVQHDLVVKAVGPASEQPWLTYGLVPFALLPTILAAFLRWQSLTSGIGDYLVNESGVFEIMLVLTQLALIGAGVHLARIGVRPLDELASLQTRDDQAIKKHGGWLLVVGAIAIALSLLQKAQTFAISHSSGRVNSASKVTETISFFDLMTWLGTFGTLAIVICGALVAIYAKRREDEAQRLDSVRIMRQEWVNKVRDLVASLTQAARILHVAATKGVDRIDLAQVALSDLRRLELHLNPTEVHHAVLLRAIKALLKQSMLDEHLRIQIAPPIGILNWEILHNWVVALAQLVLKIEWVVTSEGREAIKAKAGILWDDLNRYEQQNANSLSDMAPDAWRMRTKHGKSLVGTSKMGTDAIGQAGAPNEQNGE